MKDRIIIDFQGISTHRVELDSGYLDDIASMVFTDELGNEYLCMLHGSRATMDDNRRFLLQTAHEIADMHNRSELRREAAMLKSVRPSVLDDLDDEDLANEPDTGEETRLGINAGDDDDLPF